MTERPAGRRGRGRGRVSSGRVGRALAKAPVWVKQASAFIVGVAGVAVAVATIIGLLKSSPPPALDVKLGRPQWVAHDLTLGSYLAWQQRESDTLGLRPGGESSAAALGGTALGVTVAAGDPVNSLATADLKLVRYVSAGRGAQVQVSLPASTVNAAAPPTVTAAPGAGEPHTGESSGGSEPGPPTTNSGSETTVSPPAGPGNGAGSSEPQGGGATKAAGKGSLSRGVIKEVQSHLSSADTSRLEQKAGEQEALIKEAGAGSGPKLMRSCQGVGYGGCSPEAAEESATPPSGGTSPHDEEKVGAAPPGEGGGGAPGGPPTAAPPTGLGQRQRELLEIADGARLGRATDVALLPTPMIAGLSGWQRERVAAVLGDAVSFGVHTHGWIGQQLWLTWTMYEKQRDGFWNPSSREYLIDHAEAYLVPTATEDEGVLTFWFPIPKQRGDYRVRYFIRAPGTGKKLVEGQSPSFRS